MSDLLCIELSLSPAVSSKIHNDNRRLPVFLEQEDRFLPNASYFAQVQKIVGEAERMQTLEIIFEVRRVARPYLWGHLWDRRCYIILSLVDRGRALIKILEYLFYI